jgi:hypothetical protein
VRERLRAAGKEDLAAWQQVRAFLRGAVGESVFEIWLAPLELVAVDLEGTLVVSAPAQTAGWVTLRFRRVLDGAAQHAGRSLRVADEVERKAAEPLASAAVAPSAASGASTDAPDGAQIGSQLRAADALQGVAAGSRPDAPRGDQDHQSFRKPTYTSAYPSCYTHVYTQTREAW